MSTNAFQQNLCQTFACEVQKKLSPTNGVATKFMANFCLCSPEKKHFLPQMELPQNLWQTFACVASEKKLPPKNGVATKFMAKFCMCSTEKNFLPKMELPQNLWQSFACVASEKKTSSQKWSCHKIYGKILLV